MSRSAGTGSPLFFRCAKGRQEPYDIEVRHERIFDIELTGNMRPFKPAHGIGLRSTFTSFEYRCGCGYVGWSNHVDLARKARKQGLIEDFDR